MSQGDSVAPARNMEGFSPWPLALGSGVALGIVSFFAAIAPGVPATTRTAAVVIGWSVAAGVVGYVLGGWAEAGLAGLLTLLTAAAVGTTLAGVLMAPGIGPSVSVGTATGLALIGALGGAIGQGLSRVRRTH